MKNKIEVQAWAKSLAQASLEKKGENAVILDMEPVTTLADYFVIVSAKNYKQGQSIANEIEDKGVELGLTVLHREGYREGEWILLDFGDIVCHVFTGEARTFYGLEDLWNDAARVACEGE